MQEKLIGKLIQQSDVILIGAGAGFSADSSLPTYRDASNFASLKSRNLTYKDICDLKWLDDPQNLENISLFYGFFGSSYNAYMDTVPHDGYRKLFELVGGKAHFVYTSNVDGHFLQFFQKQRVYEFHGSFLEWQCRKLHANPLIYKLHKDYRFLIDSDKLCRMRVALPGELVYLFAEGDGVLEIQPSSCLPCCKICGGLLRPRAQFFVDDEYLWQNDEGVEYKKFVEKFCEESQRKKLILELGCGLRVPTIRAEFEEIFSKQLDLNQNIQFARVNIDEWDLSRPDVRGKILEFPEKAIDLI